MLNNIQNNLIEEFFMDTSYFCVPPSKNNFRLTVLCCYEIEANKTSLCVFILIMNDKKEIFENIFMYLKNKYKFNPKKFNVLFSIITNASN